VLGDVSNNVSWVELVWIIEGAIGAGMSLYGIYDARKDKIAVELAGLNHGMLIVARTTIQTEILRLLIQLCFLCAGLISIGYPSPPYPDSGTKWTVRILFSLIPILSGLNTLNAIFTRRRLLKEVAPDTQLEAVTT